VVVDGETARDLESVERLAPRVQRHQQPAVAPSLAGPLPFPEHVFIYARTDLSRPQEAVGDLKEALKRA
jgi:hypothetical protein